MLDVQNQPHRDRPGIRLAAGRPRHAPALRRARATAGQPGPARPGVAAEGLVARVQRRHRAAVRHLHRAGERGLGDPDLRGHADPGAAPDRGLRPRGDRRGRGGRCPGGGGAQRRRPDGPPAHPAHRGTAPAVGGARRGRAAPPGRRVGADAPAAGAPAGDERPAERRDPGSAVRGRGPPGHGTAVRDPGLPGAGRPGRRLPRGPDQRPVRGERRGSGPLQHVLQPPARHRAVVRGLGQADHLGHQGPVSRASRGAARQAGEARRAGPGIANSPGRGGAPQACPRRAGDQPGTRSRRHAYGSGQAGVRGVAPPG